MEKEPFLRLPLPERSFSTCSAGLGSRLLDFPSSLKDCVAVAKQQQLHVVLSQGHALVTFCFLSLLGRGKEVFHRESVSGAICPLIRSGAAPPK